MSNDEETRQKEACAAVLAGTILTLADVFMRRGMPRERAMMMAGDAIGESAKDIARALI